MPRPLSIALIASLCFAFPARADDKPSPAVKRILDKAVVKVRANRTEFDKANKKPLDEARAELQELAKKLVDDGKAQEATSVLKQVGTLEADVMRQANAPPPVAGGAGPQRPLLERLAGKWDITNEPRHYRLYANGVAECVFDDDGRLQQKGLITLRNADVAEILWPNQWKDELRISADDTAIAVYTFGPDGKRAGDGFAIERIK